LEREEALFGRNAFVEDISNPDVNALTVVVVDGK
jgi:hypothetical protein